MTNRTFNIDDDVYYRFSQLYKGDMSRIINEYIKQFVAMDEADRDAKELQNKITDLENNITSMRVERHRLQLVLDNKKQLNLEEEHKRQLEKAEVDEWVKNVISDAKKFKTYSDLQLRAEKENKTVEEMLKDDWNAAK